MFHYQHEPFSYKPFSPKQLWAATAPLRMYFDPVYTGLENFDPGKPALMVGNHTIYGVVDVPLLLSRIYREHGVMVRALSDHAHYDVPLWRTLLDKSGAVEGTRENCARLMERGEHVLVFPGGAREVAKRKHEKYKLVWKKRFGFVHMAIKYGYSILPFAVVGPDDMLDVVWDADDIIKSPVGRLLGKAGALEKDGVLRGGDILFPVTRGLGLTPLPRPERFYFAIGKPIDLSRYRGREDDRKVLEEVRNEVSEAIYALISEQLVKRAKDKGPGVIRRLLTSL